MRQHKRHRSKRFDFPLHLRAEILACWNSEMMGEKDQNSTWIHRQHFLKKYRHEMIEQIAMMLWEMR